MDWYLDEKIEKKIKDFQITNLKQVTNFNYYREYNDFYDVISSIELTLLYEYLKEEYQIKLKFENVSSVELTNLDYGHQDSYLSINIERINNSWEKIKYIVEDYEEQSFRFYCENYKVIGVENTNN
ncbi:MULTISPECIES: hypothetical protein [Bacillus]|uniref:hypothetical protein n=1 Tax=Bacillus TaxID=1386 RepID=UPI0010AC582E|nr:MULTISPECIES: hypothetical protein [Bacillus amyloliquefaciens group]MBW8584701.1 hypothetical protein [Bacillus amyloliquefaciens]MBY0194395.1 hypothetical protein [Bacillus velezensis]MCG0044098.1 hypothetical protein [Bacillus velezensis]MCM3371616.1 hypothetical protein [Bacillus velezensis]MDF9766445.1 hypothetical protein [Bacillus velezensis]